MKSKPDPKLIQRMIEARIEEMKTTKSLYRIKQLKKQIEQLEKERRKK